MQRGTAAARALRLPRNPQIPYLGRITWHSRHHARLRPLAHRGRCPPTVAGGGVASDCADVVAALAGGVGGYLPKRTTAILTAPCRTERSALDDVVDLEHFRLAWVDPHFRQDRAQ